MAFPNRIVQVFGHNFQQLGEYNFQSLRPGKFHVNPNECIYEVNTLIKLQRTFEQLYRRLFLIHKLLKSGLRSRCNSITALSHDIFETKIARSIQRLR